MSTIQAFAPADLLNDLRSGMDALPGEGACRVLAIRPVGGGALVE